ncbi:hypothetical protein O181_091797 [Austropuccinia psidii MF-1]|uniref:Integrase catalytic domain-containing protein n=1 Tax=Austropuccinia psidii MF-1 TaxID=1389203 RepID=A0A9Q3P8Z3_9BASI|nr:hypothetical protein [Austropuccinia psidii MF-1]
MDTALPIWNRVISWTGIFRNIISDRDPKFPSALWTNLQQLFGTKLSFSTAYHPKTDGLAERMIQTLEDMVRRLCAYGLEIEDYDGFTPYWCTLLLALELAYRNSIHASTNQTTAILEKGWNPQLPQDSLRKNKHHIFPVSLINQYKSSDSEKFPLRKKAPQHIPPIESSGTKKITKVLKERK